jgi:galactonate dehydratase
LVNLTGRYKQLEPANVKSAAFVLSRNRAGAHDVAGLEGAPMKITKLETLHCDAGWRVNSFLKLSTDEGITGWSEFMEGYGAQGLATVIEKLGARLVGQDPRPVERHSAYLYAATRQAAGGLNAQAIGAIENALVDIKAKALGVPV